MNTRSVCHRLPAILLALLWTLASATSGYSAPTTLQPDSDPAAPTAPVYRWRQVNVGLEDPFAMQFSSDYAANGQIYAFKDFNTLYVGHGYGAIFRSETHGATWGVYASPPPSFQLVAVSPETPAGPVFLGVEDYYDAEEGVSYFRLLRSTGTGSGWTSVWNHSPLFNQIVFSPAFATDHVVFVTFADSPAGGIWKSTDGGVTWHPEQKIAVHPNNGRVISLAFSPNFAVDQTMMASVPAYWDGEITWPGGSYRSEDGGNVWTPSDAGCLGRVWKLAFSPTFAADQTVYAQGEDSTDLNNSRVYRSTNQGRTWECLPNQPGAGVIFDIALSPAFATDHTLLLGTAGRGLVRSTDGGASWVTLAWNQSGVQYAYFSPNYAQDHTLAVALKGMQFGYNGPAGNFLSYDGGQSWQPAGIYPAPVQALAISPAFATDHSLWASIGAGQANAVRSTDGGAVWLTQLRWITYWPPFSSMAAIPTAAVAKTDGGHKVFATSVAAPIMGGGVYYSNDGGVSYYPGINGPLYGNVTVVSPEFASDLTVWVGAYFGLFHSTNAGVNWSQAPGDLPAGNVTGLAASPDYANDRTLFAVVAGNGGQAQVYRTRDAGAHWTLLPLPAGVMPTTVAVSPAFAADHGVWVSSVAHGVFRSTSQGDAWLAPTTVLGGCGPVQVGGADAGRLLWAACNGSLHRSADDGATWAPDGPTGVTVTQVVAAADGDTVFIGSSASGIYRRERIYTVMLPVVVATP